MSFDFFPREQSATLLNAARNPSLIPEAGAFDNFLPGAGAYAMRSLAEVGRAVDMAGSVFPIAYDAITGDKNNTERDRYFDEHNAVFNHAVDYWTPKPGEVGAAGQITGQLAGGVLQAVVAPALLVATSQLSAAEDLARQGVDAGAANVVGDIAGIGAAVGLKLPFLGKTLASRVLTGAAGNVVQGAATAGASHAVLDAAGNPVQAAQYDALDIKARLLDAMLGAAFGGLAHLDAKLTPTDKAALLVANQARHLEDTTAPGRPATDTDRTQHVQAMREAIEQVLNGEPVAVDGPLRGVQFHPDEAQARARTEVADEALRIASQEKSGEPIAPTGTTRPAAAFEASSGLTDNSPAGLTTRIARAVRQFLDGEPVTGEARRPDTVDPVTAKARQAVAENPDLLYPTGQVNADGSPMRLRAADALALADAEAAHAKDVGIDVFRTAANCLLGAL